MTEGSRELNLCVAAARPCAELETFVRAHAERLPGPPVFVCGSELERTMSGRRAGPPGIVRRLGAFLSRASGRGVDRALVARSLREFLRRRRFAVVLAEFGPTGVLLAEPCRRAGVPLVVHFHGYDAYRQDVLAVHGGEYGRMFQACAAVVAVSRPMTEQLRLLGAPAEKIRLNSYGADCDLFTPTDAAANPPLFAGVGRFVAKKAPHLTLLAFRRVLDACPEARMKLIGDGPLLSVCRDIVDGAGMADAVELIGAVPHAAVAQAMQGARAFVQHSVQAADGDCEGSPVAVMEAGAAGLPVVATRHAGIPETVVDGTTGLLVDEYDVPEMAAHMVELARDPALAGRMGRAGRERICTQFSMANSIGRLTEILAEAAER